MDLRILTPLEAKPAPTPTPRSLAPRSLAPRRVVWVAVKARPPMASSTVLRTGTANTHTKQARASIFWFILKAQKDIDIDLLDIL